MGFRDLIAIQRRPAWLRPSGPSTPPTFFCVGAMKSGTTTLHEYLAQHPEVSVPDGKEINFFYRSLSNLTIDEYEALFDPAMQARGECCPQYHHLADTIALAYPAARIIYMVRDPVARITSHLKHLASKGTDIKPLIDRLAGPLEGFDVGTGSYIIRRTRYRYDIERYRANYFNILVVPFDDIIREQADTFRRICSFIGVSEYVSSPIHAHKIEGQIDLPAEVKNNISAHFASDLEWLEKEYMVRFQQ